MARGSAYFARLEGCVSALSQERAMVAYVTNCYEIRKCHVILCYTKSNFISETLHLTAKCDTIT